MQNKPVVLFRTLPHQDEKELAAIRKYFDVYESRCEIKPGMLVIGRYSVLPFYREQERDINLMGATLINTHYQHQYIAHLMSWYGDLEGLTPRSWMNLEECPIDGPFVLKGATNSRKFQWDTHMLAKTRKDAAEICVELQNDSLLGSQDIIVREYVPLKTYMTAIHGLPITKEFRFFVAYGQILSSGYYWSSHIEDLNTVPDPSEVPKKFLDTVIYRIGKKASFYAIDVAQTESGEWIVVELNDGQQSGLSENDPEVLYKNLKSTILSNFSSLSA
jgi:hypothetical protein